VEAVGANYECRAKDGQDRLPERTNGREENGGRFEALEMNVLLELIALSDQWEVCGH
jgi:hypothetical protein